jgi:hypothetical protein
MIRKACVKITTVFIWPARLVRILIEGGPETDSIVFRERWRARPRRDGRLDAPQ